MKSLTEQESDKIFYFINGQRTFTQFQTYLAFMQINAEKAGDNSFSLANYYQVILDNEKFFKRFIDSPAAVLAIYEHLPHARNEIVERLIFDSNVTLYYTTIKEIAEKEPELGLLLLKQILTDKEKVRDYFSSADAVITFIELFPKAADIILEQMLDDAVFYKMLNKVNVLQAFFEKNPQYQEILVNLFLKTHDIDYFRKHVVEVLSFTLIFPKTPVEILSVLFSDYGCIVDMAKGNSAPLAEKLGIETARSSVITALIKEADENERLKTTLHLLAGFLSDDKPLWFTKKSRLEIVLDLLAKINSPSLISQPTSSNLCGPATFMNVLADKMPEQYVLLALTLAEQGKITQPMLVQSPDAFKEKYANVSDLTIASLRHASNIFGYISLFEKVSATTRPKALVRWLETWGFSDVMDNTICTMSNGKEIPLLVRGVFGGVYSDKHQQSASIHDNLLSTIKQMENGNCALGLIDSKLTSLIRGEDYVEASPVLNMFEATHYVYINKLTYDEPTNKVHIEISTYGKEYQNDIPLEDFLDGFKGSIIAKPPSPAPELIASVNKSS